MISKTTSDIISVVRFPLAIMVIYIHYFGGGDCSISNITLSSISLYDIYNIQRILVSKTICLVAVPAFFIISGYLFFQKLDKWDWNVWINKLQRRFYSLIIPYILWNIIRYVFNVITMFLAYMRHNEISDFIIWLDANTGFYIFWAMPETGMPIHTPFWFIRDLILLVCLTPLISFLLKKKVLSCIYMLLLFIVYVYNYITPVFLGSLFFFSLGGWLAFGKFDCCDSSLFRYWGGDYIPVNQPNYRFCTL